MFKTHSYNALYLTLLLLLLAPQSGLSVEAPEAVHLQSISEGLHAPIRIAADAAGNIYVTDTSGHRVCVFDASGNLLRQIHGIQAPLGVAVDHQNRLYIGDKETGSVSIFTPEGASIGRLGTGDGQFTMPTDIAVDSQNRIYVVDSKQNCVKVFDENGDYESQFGDAKLMFPTGIAIDEANNTIFIGQYGTMGSGGNSAGVHVFDMEGNWKGSIGKYGAKAGEFTRVQGLAVDGQGRLYVADCFQSTVQVVDYAGRGLSFIGSYGTEPGQLRLPSDVIVDPYNRLWVTSTDSGRIEVFGIDEYGSPDTQTTAQDGFVIDLTPGINFISAPLKPASEWKLSDLAAHIGSGIISIVVYDSEKGSGSCYIPGFADGALANMPVKGCESYIVIMGEGKSVKFHGTAWEGEVTLPAGMSMFAVPLQPSVEWQLSDLADYIGVELIHLITYNDVSRRFETYIPGVDSSFDANVEGGMGYLAVMSESTTVVFEGEAWRNKSPASLAPGNYDVAQVSNASVLTIQGKVLNPKNPVDVPSASGETNIQVKNRRTGAVKTITTDSNGDYVAAFVDFIGSKTASVGDAIQVKATDPEWVSETITYTLTADDIRMNHIILPAIQLEVRPKKSVLLNNYPNPFNPDTWIPFRLSRDAEVTIQIYNVTGQLVRTLALGAKAAGHYVTREQAVHWDGTNDAGEVVASGVYFYTIRAGAFEAIRRMVVLR